MSSGGSLPPDPAGAGDVWAYPGHMARLERSHDHRIVAGVCGGIADWLGWSPNTVRLLFVLSFIFPGPQAVFYLVAWIIMPDSRR